MKIEDNWPLIILTLVCKDYCYAILYKIINIFIFYAICTLIFTNYTFLIQV